VQQFSDVGDSDDARHYRDFTVIPGPDPRLQQAGRLEESGCGVSERPDGQFSFRPERVLFRPGEAVPMYASAQPLDFLARTKNPSFPNRKLPVSHPEVSGWTLV